MVKISASLVLMGVLSGVSSLSGKDFGVQGAIGSIDETDPRVLIFQRLKALESSGEIVRHQEELQKMTRARVNRPKPVVGITKAIETRIFEYDPTYVVPQDFKDHLGQVFARKGDRINPLETVSFQKAFLFIDGDDEEQVLWAKQKIGQGPSRIVLVSGAPLELSGELKIPVYFDQGGSLTTRFNIKHVPASVHQEGLKLRITEEKSEEKQNETGHTIHEK